MNPEDMSPDEMAKLQKEQCIFCKIIKGEIPSNKIYEDDDVLVILDINPANEGHLILMPKEHYQIMPQIPEAALTKLFSTSQKLSKVLLQSLQTGGTTLFIANGAAAGQRAPHFMMHIVPRKKDDGLFNIPKKDQAQDKLKQIQQALIKNLTKLLGKPPIQIKKEADTKPQEKSVPKENKNKIDDKQKTDNDLDKIGGMFLK